MAGDERTEPKGRLRRLWQRLLRRPNPDENVAVLNRKIEETNRRAHQAFLRALRDVEKEESGAQRALLRNLRRKPPFVDAFNAAATEMERTIQDLRASRRTVRGQSEIDDKNPRKGMRAAQEKLEQLERNLKQLAKSRDTEAENANEWERRAMMAVHAEHDELSREALQRKKEHEFLHRLFTREHEHGVRVIAILRELLESVESNTATKSSSESEPKQGE
jgi:phage shock protein A